MTVRYYSSIAQQTTLTASISPSNTTIAVASTTGFPGSTPFTLALDYGGANEELVDVTMVAGLSLTVTRAVDSTPASSHNAGAVVRHVSSARDFRDSRDHENASTDVHGLTGGAAVVGTTQPQTLSNKTLNRATGDLQNVDIYNVGASNVFTVIGDSANLAFNRQAWWRDEISLQQLSVIDQNGGFQAFNPDASTDNFYRLRVANDTGTTDRFTVVSGGTVGVFPSTTTTAAAVGIGIDTANISNSQSAIQISNINGTSPRFRVFEDGRLGVQPDSGSSAFTSFFVQSPGATGTNSAWLDSGGTIRSFIRADGTAFFRPRTVSGTPTALTGWSLIQSSAFSVGGIGFFQVQVNKITADSASANATGDFSPDLMLATIPSNWLPVVTTQPHMITSMSSSRLAQCWLDSPTATLRVGVGSPNLPITNGSSIWMNWSYPIAE